MGAEITSSYLGNAKKAFETWVKKFRRIDRSGTNNHFLLLENANLKKLKKKGWNQKESRLKFKLNIISKNVEVKVSNKKKGKI